MMIFLFVKNDVEDLKLVEEKMPKIEKMLKLRKYALFLGGSGKIEKIRILCVGRTM